MNIKTEFDFDVFRETFTGGARQLAYACKFIAITKGLMLLQISRIDVPLLDTFGDSLREQIGIYQDELRVVVIVRDEAVQP